MKIAILIPCLNESLTIKKVIDDFKYYLPSSEIFVYDNASEDDTYQIAKEAGATVRIENNRGKANVILRMFNEIEADYYIMIDGDDTYPVDVAPKLINLMINENADMIIGDRLSNKSYSVENKRKFHGFGNSLVKLLINKFFNSDITDVLTGYRVLSKRLVKNYTSSITGFELETDLTLFCLSYDLKVRQYPIEYRDRPKGSVSKLNTYTDGFKVLLLFFNLYRFYKPLYFFGYLAIVFFAAGMFLGVFPIKEYIFNEGHYITKVPTAILSISLIIISILLLAMFKL